MDYKNDKIKIIPCAFFRPGVMQGQAYYLNPVRSKKLLRGKEPLIFNKKQKKHIKVIPLTVKTSDTGQTRHFTPAIQEWRNSIYAYNKNYTKLLPAADNNFMRLVKSYFNFYFRTKKTKKPIGKQKISIRKRSRSRGLSAKKIFVAKGGLKHTSTKAVITLYLYNTEKKFLIRNLKKQIFQLYRPNKGLKRQINLDRNQKVIVSYNRPFSLKEYLLRHDHYTDYITSFKMSFVEKLCKYFNLTNKYINLISNLVESKGLSEEEKLLIFLACGEKVYSFYTIKYPNYQDYMHKVKLHYLNKLTLYLKLLILNQIKFKHAFLLELRYLVSEIYNKNVEFNLVNLKKMHLNSDIFTQAVSLKLKNRNNRLYKVLISSLSKVKLPNVNRIKEKYNKKSNKEQLLINKMRNLKINSLFAFGFLSSEAGQGLLSLKGGREVKRTKDSLNKLLLKNFPFFNTIKAHLAFSPLPPQLVEVEQGRMGRSYVERNQVYPLALPSYEFKEEKSRYSAQARPISLRNSILRSLKHINMAGIRIEAKGRLTRRFTASRSVFKMRWKGGLKNVDSSFRGLSAVILRGHVKSNVEYSMLHSKNRNGAFGVKGWVSSK